MEQPSTDTHKVETLGTADAAGVLDTPVQPELFRSPRAAGGIPRPSCACPDCVRPCKVMPGYLVPKDLTNLMPEGTDPFKWAMDNLLASPGALVTDGPVVIRIGTLVPSHKPGTWGCHWLDEDLKCKVHRDSPFGCAFGIAHPPEKDRELGVPSDNGHRAALDRLNSGVLGFLAEYPGEQLSDMSLYERLWVHLWNEKKIAMCPHFGRFFIELLEEWETKPEDNVSDITVVKSPEYTAPTKEMDSDEQIIDFLFDLGVPATEKQAKNLLAFNRTYEILDPLASGTRPKRVVSSHELKQECQDELSRLLAAVVSVMLK